MKKVLFVCMGNTCRSPMAMFIYKKYFPEREVFSAGLSPCPGYPISENAKEVLLKNGFNKEEIDAFKSTYVLDYDLDDFDVIYSLTPFIGENINNPKIKIINIDDPFGQELEVYEKTFKDIENEIKALKKG